MSKKILFISLMICVLFSVNHAQNIEGVNARIDGMAGAGIPDDIGWCFLQGRNFIKFPDYIHGNAVIKPFWGTEEIFGGMIILKSLGERVVAGISANNPLIMGGDFYYRSFTFLEASGDFGLTPGDLDYTKLPAFPQIGASIKITDDINVGLVVFGEGIQKNSEQSIPGIAVDIDPITLVKDTLFYQDSSRSRKYTNFGFNLDANMMFGKIGFAPRVRLGFPRIKGDHNLTKTAATGGETRSAEYESDAGLLMQLGTAAWFVGLKYPIVGGIYFIQEKYQFTKTLTGMGTDTTIQSKAFKNNIVFFFCGTEIHFGNGFMFTPELDLEFVNLHLDGLKNNMALHDSVRTYNKYTIRMGIEKRSKKLRFLDELVTRCGLVYKYAQSRAKVEDAAGNEDTFVNMVETNNEKHSGNRGTKLAAGLGLTKGRFTLDISSDLMAFDGTFLTGPKAAILSLTVDIAKNARYKMDDSSEPVAEEPPPVESFESQTPASQSEDEYPEPSDDFNLDSE